MTQDLKSIKIKNETLNKLRQLAHSGQSIDGVIQELMEKAGKTK